MEQQSTQLKQLPPTYNGKAWTFKLLAKLSAPELRRLIAIYGVDALNAATQKNAARGIR